MNRKLSPRNVDISMSGACPVCGDLLFTPPASAKDQTLAGLQKVLEDILQSHFVQKHRRGDLDGD